MANSLGERPGMGKPWWGRSLYWVKNWAIKASSWISSFQDLSINDSLKVLTNLSAIPLEWGRWRAIRTWIKSEFSANCSKVFAMKWVPRSVIKKWRSGGRRTLRASIIICEVTFGPTTKRGKPRHWRVQLSTMTRIAIQAVTTGNWLNLSRRLRRFCRQSLFSSLRFSLVSRRCFRMMDQNSLSALPSFADDLAFSSRRLAFWISQAVSWASRSCRRARRWSPNLASSWRKVYWSIS